MNGREARTCADLERTGLARGVRGIGMRLLKFNLSVMAGWRRGTFLAVGARFAHYRVFLADHKRIS